MKKFAKMSLVAAVAVAGLSSSVSAQPLAEAIQNVNVTGSVAMKYDDRFNTKAETQALKGSTFKAILNAKSKVNDDLTANVTVIARSVDTDTNAGGAAAIPSDGSSSGTVNSDVEMNHINFIYTGWANTTAILGKQAFDTPFTDPADPIDGADTATGYTVVYKAGPATLVGAYYGTNSADSQADIRNNNVTYLAAMGSIGGVKLDAHYITLGDEQAINSAFAEGADLVKLGVSGKVAGISLAANYVSLDDDADTGATFADKQQTYNISAAGKAGDFGLSVKYVNNDEDGGAVALEHDSSVNAQAWGIAVNNTGAQQFDNSAVIAAITYPLNDSMGLKLYGGVNDYKATKGGLDVEQEELVFQFTHSLSKNFSYYVRLGQLNTDYDASSTSNDEEQTRGRIYGAYKF